MDPLGTKRREALLLVRAVNNAPGVLEMAHLNGVVHNLGGHVKRYPVSQKKNLADQAIESTTDKICNNLLA